MKKYLLALILLSGALTFACKSDEEARQEDQVQEDHTDSLRNSVLNSAETDSFLTNDSGQAPVTNDTLKNNPAK